MYIIFHGAYVEQDNGVGRYAVVEENKILLYSMNTKSYSPVTIVVTGRKSSYSYDDFKKRVKIIFEDGKTDGGFIYWSESGNESRLRGLRF